MPDPTITPLSPSMPGTTTSGSVDRKSDTGFGELLKRSIESVNSSIQEANQSQAGLISGEHSNIHETMIAMEKAGIQFRLLTRVQNKVVDAYKEIMRMQL